MKIRIKTERFLEKWGEWVAFVLVLLACLSPLGMAISLAILVSPWCLFVLTIYIFLGPIFVLGIKDCWELARYC